MHRIDNPTAAAALPTPKPAGPQGFYSNGNPQTGTAATIVEADHLNSIQEELVNVVLRAGMTLDKQDNTQLLQAIATMAFRAFTLVTVTQQIPVPDWATRIEFELVGGGGAGAHSDSDAFGNWQYGAGGGAGAYAQAIRTVIPGALLTAVIGAGGAPGNPAGAGGTTSLAATGDQPWAVSGTGGEPGVWDAPNNAPGGPGGGANGGDVNAGGSWGSDGQSGDQHTVGNGAASFYGGAGRAGAGGGANGAAPGSGGGGAYFVGLNGPLYLGGRGGNGHIKYRFLP